jgi:small conductance mechanosensitive channel
MQSIKIVQAQTASERVAEAFERYWDGILESLPEVTTGIVLLLVFLTIGWLLKRLFERRISRRIHDKLLTQFVGRMVFLIFFLMGLVSFLSRLGLARAAGGLLAGAGVSALILGFAFRDIGENLLSGVFLALGRPFRIGDIIQVEGHQGRVRGLTLRNTHIRTHDGRDIFIPNASLIKSPLINFTRDGLMRHDFTIGLDYGSDLRQAYEHILKVLYESTDISQEEDIRPFVVIDQFASSTLVLRIYFWINTNDFLGSISTLKSNVMLKVYEALVAAGVNMPADIIELKTYQEQRPLQVAVQQVGKGSDPTPGPGT